MKKEQTNNLNINIPEFLSKHYPKWGEKYPEIFQLNENFEIIREWKNKKDIINYCNKKIQGLDLALRNSCRFQGYFWVIKVLYEKEGLRPLKTIKRNDAIYAYNPSEEILKKYYDYEDINVDDFFKPGIRETFQFIGRFNNSVAISKELDLSITNIRRVAKRDPNIIFHKDYWFSFVPLMRIHQLESDIIELNNYNKRGVLKNEDKIKLINYIKEFKELWNEKRVLGFTEKEIYKLVENLQIN